MTARPLPPAHGRPGLAGMPPGRRAAGAGRPYLLLGEVTGAGIRRPGEPMVLWQTPWSYGGMRE